MSKNHKIPLRIILADVPFRAVVMRIESRDEDGRPEGLTLIPDQRTVELSDDPDRNEFIIAYMKEATYEGKTN